MTRMSGNKRGRTEAGRLGRRESCGGVEIVERRGDKV